MQKVARAWNQGNAEAAVSRFTEDAIYSGPPSAGHGGRKSLYEIFWWRERARASYGHGLAQPDLRPRAANWGGRVQFSLSHANPQTRDCEGGPRAHPQLARI